MKKTYANYREDMRIGDVIKYNGEEWVVDLMVWEGFNCDGVKGLEVISQAPRQVLTWEWCKERVDQWPLPMWINAIQSVKDIFIFGNKESFRIKSQVNLVNWDECINIFTEPSTPTLIDLVEHDDVDDDVKRLWWYKSRSNIIYRSDVAYTEAEFLAVFKPLEYCPAEEVPHSSKWVKV